MDGTDGTGGRQRSQGMISCLVSRLASIGVLEHSCIFSSGQGLAVTDLTTPFRPSFCFGFIITIALCVRLSFSF